MPDSLVPEGLDQTTQHLQLEEESAWQWRRPRE